MPHLELISTAVSEFSKPISAMIILCPYLIIFNSVPGEKLVNLLMSSLGVILPSLAITPTARPLGESPDEKGLLLN